MKVAPNPPPSVDAALAVHPEAIQTVLHELRALILDVASVTDGIGDVTETLKWGQPSFSVPTGTPLRIGVTKAGAPALFVHCQTTVIADARAVFSGDLRFEGNRAVVFDTDTALPESALRHVIRAALTYRL
ncbi:DUF1801 domain-containing protein [Marivita hallyeonensis]|uniref:DUF1801 domain-containing protein n=1 Tax=Marivita hallyeonensis TaxID=996342 RepID=UPI001C4A10ED|nr:DUF1801 domain-containing protein [Marivita hallyeonensis]